MSTPSPRSWGLIAFGTAVSLAAIGLMDCVTVWSPGTASRGPGGPVAEIRGSGVPLVRPVQERLGVIDARLRLPPDWRAMHAVVELETLMRRTPADDVRELPQAIHHEGRWTIMLGDAEIGDLPELPTFADILALLDARAEHLRRSSIAPDLIGDPDIRPELADLLAYFDDRAAFRLLEIVDGRWNEGRASVGDLRAAAHAMAQLSLILWDDFEIADLFSGKALALLAFARLHGKAATTRAECHLSLALRYSSHARRQVERLPRGDPFRVYATGDLDALRSAAAGDAPSPEARFLYGLRLAEESRYSEWLDWLRGIGPDAQPVPLVRTYLTGGELRSAAWVPDYLTLMIQQIAGVPNPPNLEGADVFARADLFLLHLDGRARVKTGPLVGAEDHRAFYRALFFTSIYQKYLYHNNMRGSAPDLRDFARTLEASSDADVRAAAEFAGLMDFRAARSREEDVRRRRVLEMPSVLGARQRLHLARMLYVPMPTYASGRLDVADVMARYLDSRPRHVLWASELARDVYLDPALELRLTEAAIARDPLANFALRLQLATRRGDEDELWRLLEETSSVDERLEVLSALWKIENVDRARIRRAYEREAAAPEPKLSVLRAYAGYLWVIEKDREEARRVLLGVLANPRDAPPVALSHIVARVARLYREDALPEKAWALLEPQLDSWVGSVLAEGVRASVALGDLERAEWIARRAYQRYPGADTAGAVASVLWRQGRHDEAADVILQSPDLSGSQARRDLIWAFIDVFADSNGPEMEAAFSALVSARVPFDLAQGIIVTMRESKTRPDLAFALSQRMAYPSNRIVILTEAYLSLRQVRGEQEAVEWLRAELPASWLDVSAPIFYLRGADELLWSMTTHPENGQGDHETWLLRAAALLRASAPSGEHRRLLLEHYESHNESFMHRLGAVLVGLASEDEILESAQTEEDLCLAASFLGLRAELQGRPRHALRLYQLARTTSPRATQNYAPVDRLSSLRADWPKRDPAAPLTAGTH